MIARELPPTAGLPLQWRDFVPRRGIESLEDALAHFLNVPAVQIECSGTAALVVALEALKRRSRRSTVVIPAYTCHLVPLAVHHAGLRVRLCDTAPDRFDLDRERLDEACDDDTLCVVPTHIGGAVTDLSAVVDIAASRGAYVVEDAAQALGAFSGGRAVGTVGDVGFYSLACGKGLTLYQGGVLVARDAELRGTLALESRRQAGRGKTIELLRLVQLAGYALSYNPIVLRWIYGLPLRFWLARGAPARAIGERPETIPIHRVSQARKRVGASAFTRLREWLRQGAERGRRRARRIAAIDGLEVVEGAPGSEATWPLLLVLLRSPDACDRALAELWRSGLGVTRLFHADLHGYDFLQRMLPPTPTPNARSFARRLISISNSPWLAERDFDRVVDTLAEAVRRSS